MTRRLKVFATAVLMLSGLNVFAQTFSPDSLNRRFFLYSSLCSPEKLYVHLDRTYFTVNETIWFEAYLSDASKFSILPASNYVYAELLDSAGLTVTRVKIKRGENGFSGHMYIPTTLETGFYTFRAYTVWQLNRSPEFMFNQKIRILGAKPFTDKKAEPLRPGDYDVSFYPEGGRYFAGVLSSIAFKALARDGRSVDVSGFLVSESDGKIFPMGTTYDGMGVVNFVPSEGVRYFFETQDGRRFPLPEPSKQGASVGVRGLNDLIVLYVNGIAEGNFYLALRNSKTICTVARMELDGQQKAFRLDGGLIQPGINHALIVNERGKIVSERLFFIYDNETPKAEIAAYDDTPRPHGIINTKVTLKDASGAPLDGNFSISVTRGSFKNHCQDDGLVSYTYLSSEIKGHINNPSYYFDEAVSLHKRKFNMDLLMMIQGWRYYELEKMFDPQATKFILTQLKETHQSIRGKIERRSNNDKIPKNFIFSVIIPDLKINRFVSVEQARTFTIDSLDFKEGTGFLISITRNGIGAGYIPKWSGEDTPPSFSYSPAKGIVGAVTEPERIPLVSEIAALDTLEAAVVTASRDDAFNGYLNGHTVSADDLKMNGFRTLVEYITSHMPQFEYDGENMYNRNLRRGTEAIEENGEDSENTVAWPTDAEGNGSGSVKLIVEDIESPWWVYDQTRCDEIEALNVSTQPDALYNSPGGLVMLKVKEGVVRTADVHPSFLYFVPLGYQEPKEFYSPRYDLGDRREEFDHRNTIYWSPSTSIRNGFAPVTFCNTDQLDYPYIVRIEGLTSSGVPFSTHTELKFNPIEGY